MSAFVAFEHTSLKSLGTGGGNGGCPSLLTALFCAGGLLLQTAAGAAPGALDPSFGTGGLVTTNLGGVAQANGAAFQTDGKVIVAGFAAPTSTGKGKFLVARYADNGALDPSFGAGGKTVTAFGKDGRALSVALQTDGRIVAAGFTQAANGRQRFALVRYRTDGHVDSSFGTGGKATTSWGTSGISKTVAIAPDGKIVAAGWSIVRGSQQFAVARYLPNGHLDRSFGTAGQVSTSLGQASAVEGVVVQSDGKVVAAGYVTEPGHVDHVALVRYLVNGNSDPTFGANGTVVTDLGGHNLARALALQPDGKIVAAGHMVTSRSFFAVVRYDTNGQPDASFGNGGVALTDFGADAVAFAVAVSPGGNILAGGFAYPPGQVVANFALASYTPSGSLDPSFGSGGKVTTDFGGYDQVNAVAFHGAVNPTIIAVGFTGPDGNGGKFALARYFGD